MSGLGGKLCRISCRLYSQKKSIYFPYVVCILEFRNIFKCITCSSALITYWNQIILYKFSTDWVLIVLDYGIMLAFYMYTFCQSETKLNSISCIKFLKQICQFIDEKLYAQKISPDLVLKRFWIEFQFIFSIYFYLFHMRFLSNTLHRMLILGMSGEHPEAMHSRCTSLYVKSLLIVLLLLSTVKSMNL